MALGLLALSSPARAGQSHALRCYAVFTTHGRALDEIARSYELLIWHNHPDLLRVLPQLRARNPRITALVYREFFCVQRDETPLAETVGQYAWISEHHPDWFQKDTSGRPVEIPDYPGRFMMDPGNPGWQDFWIGQTVQTVRDGAWDGVFLDDVLTSVRMHGLPPLAGYPDDASLQQAMHGFLKKAYAAFRTEGKLMVANVSNSYDYPGLFELWIEVTDGIMEEHFCGESWSWGQHTAREQLEAMQAAHARGKRYLCMTYGSWEDTALRDLSLAAYLIGSNQDAYWCYRPDRDTDERFPVIPQWALDLGGPVAGARHTNGVWHREFQNGSLFLNVSPNAAEADYLGQKHSIEPYSFRLFRR